MEESKTGSIEGTIVDVSLLEQIKPEYDWSSRMFEGFKQVNWIKTADSLPTLTNTYVRCLFGNQVLYNCFVDEEGSWLKETGEDTQEIINTPDAWSYQ